MAGRIHTPRWPNRLIKPPYGAVEIDWAHPLAHNLAGCWLFNDGAGNATSLIPSEAALIRYNATWVNTVKGVAANLNGSSAYFGHIDPLDTSNFAYRHRLASGVGGLTVWAFLRDDAAYASLATYHRLVAWGDASANNRFLQVNLCQATGAARGISLFLGGEASPNIACATNIPTGPLNIVATLTDNRAGGRVWVNGNLNDGAAPNANASVYASTRFHIGQRGDNGGYMAGDVYAVAVWYGRQLTQADAVILHADPYCFLRPIVRRSYGFVGGGAAPQTSTATAALAHSVAPAASAAPGAITTAASASWASWVAVAASVVLGAITATATSAVLHGVVPAATASVGGVARTTTAAVAHGVAPAASAAVGGVTATATPAIAHSVVPAADATAGITVTATPAFAHGVAPSATASPGAISTPATAAVAHSVAPNATAAPGAVTRTTTSAVAPWTVPSATAEVAAAATATPAVAPWVVPAASVTVGAITRTTTPAVAPWLVPPAFAAFGQESTATAASAVWVVPSAGSGPWRAPSACRTFTPEAEDRTFRPDAEDRTWRPAPCS